jgi:catechol-2,3-dioxygenase
MSSNSNGVSVDGTQRKATAIGINHVALEVGDIGAALEFYGRFLNFEITAQSESAAFIYFGDQFINFAKGRTQATDQQRHFGIAVDDKELARTTLESMGVTFLDSRFLDFLDPWGNRVEITTYANIQFSKSNDVLHAMGMAHVEKTDSAKQELARRGMGPVAD